MVMVSVIMSVYNLSKGKVLKESITSILNQTYCDFELIICDDGSTDKTYELLKEFKIQDKRIKLLRNEKNYRAAYARNRCIETAQGKYIAIMDGDDISHPKRLEKQVLFLENHDEYEFVGTKGVFFRDDSSELEGEYWFCERPSTKDFLFTLPFVHASVMFRARAIKDVGGYDLSKHVVRAEDYDLFLRLYASGHYGKNLEEALYFIRRDANQYRRRKYCYRINEVYVRFRGYKKLKLFPKAWIYVVKPLIVGLIPPRLVTSLQGIYYCRK